ncbi:CRTAC1 family protein [Rhizobium sp. 1AS11]|uniref:CRTAC1 family protein n=1 Tax=Rhizobium acaciae TaxID=2989736 RepID=UPI0022217666|nr:CRTAC1 family protein [Rhizobium acaciae]MCW1408223.1 CRTAC1 family protein [Rhizobium acaciae]MCW1740374.1 CRTAC1 family protein [Rhizobium acaciae]
MKEALARHAGRITAGLIAFSLLCFAAVAQRSQGTEDISAERFAFERVALNPADISGFRTVRPVHPDLRHIDAWISSVGASVAIGDLDGDGLSNDACLIDPRNDTISILSLSPSPGFASFTLSTPADRYEVSTTAPTGCLLADANADGHEDVVVYYWGRTPGIFENTGQMSGDGFVFHEIIDGGEVWFTNAAVFADIDGDGFGDLMFGNYFPDESGVLDTSGHRPVEMQHSMSRAFNGGKDRLFLNTAAGNGRFAFADRSDALTDPMANGWTLALGAADLSHDGYPEVYVANDFGPDRLLLNLSRPHEPSFRIVEGRRRLTDIRSGVVGRDSFKGMGVDFADIDGDGGLDIYVSNIAEDYALLESHLLFMHQADQSWDDGVAPYHNAAGALGLARSSWSWDAKLADIDSDGVYEALQATGFVKGLHDRWPELQELAMGNDELLSSPEVWPRFAEGDALSGDRPDAFFVRGSNGRFHDIAAAIGLGEPSISRGIALADIDGDGDLDFALARQWEPSVLFINMKGQKRKSLLLDLRLTNPDGSTRPAIGAVATVTFPDGRKLSVISDSSNGHSGHRSPEVHFGLGEITTEVPVTVTWRSASGPHKRDFHLSPGRHKVILDNSPNLVSLGKSK